MIISNRLRQLATLGLDVALFLLLDADRDDKRKFARDFRILLRDSQKAAMLRDRRKDTTK